MSPINKQFELLVDNFAQKACDEALQEVWAYHLTHLNSASQPWLMTREHYFRVINVVLSEKFNYVSPASLELLLNTPPALSEDRDIQVRKITLLKRLPQSIKPRDYFFNYLVNLPALKEKSFRTQRLVVQLNKQHQFLTPEEQLHYAPDLCAEALTPGSHRQGQSICVLTLDYWSLSIRYNSNPDSIKKAIKNILGQLKKKYTNLVFDHLQGSRYHQIGCDTPQWAGALEAMVHEILTLSQESGKFKNLTPRFEKKLLEFALLSSPDKPHSRNGLKL